MGVINILDKVVTYLIIFVFGMSGSMKLYPFNPDFYNEMKEKFELYATVCPTVYVGYTPPPATYLMVVGLWEVFCAAGLLISSDLKGVASFILSVIMAGAVYTHFMVDDLKGAPLPAVLMIMCLFLFVRSRTDRNVQQKQKND